MKKVYPSVVKVKLPKTSTIKFLLDFSKSLSVLSSKKRVYVLPKN
ncbi:hypothetical protein [Riemerella anatipestifer]|uniref:Uncharacterized protein n=1 Tax=Riemerella anatipestifer (strain ATCC 11845 / DSM 15868 / JCM 9532 / NCTC 11014) TaxID=693978 RepID=H8MBW2_RIEAD|nr:hypothetical protein [Riemerella anatipestifer]AFD56427.1 hypothetical protein RA0C_1535 [Riemerella anatipestifer ATCC 11845 = DSM 15868]AGC39643.1 hypothetical protein G148_0338 [Riemerella anatipestifer RA-CH-2]AKP69620.1 hypothetical protein CG08_1410 [Riemerella anatipestifer]AKP71529.1 hypothetical protein CG09_1350 [Riemerella anatipestifer]EFT36825.1 hypothetical protein RAYM_00370 [Riemerella anatipestifer RA-YM]